MVEKRRFNTGESGAIRFSPEDVDAVLEDCKKEKRDRRDAPGKGKHPAEPDFVNSNCREGARLGIAGFFIATSPLIFAHDLCHSRRADRSCQHAWVRVSAHRGDRDRIIPARSILVIQECLTRYRQSFGVRFLASSLISFDFLRTGVLPAFFDLEETLFFVGLRVVIFFSWLLCDGDVSASHSLLHRTKQQFTASGVTETPSLFGKSGPMESAHKVAYRLQRNWSQIHHSHSFFCLCSVSRETPP